MPLVDVCAETELPAGRPRVVHVDGRALVLFRHGDELHAHDDACPRDGAPLSEGRLEGTVLRCARDGARFELRTGRCLSEGEDLRRAHARIEDGRVLVQVEPLLPEVEQARIVASLRTALIDDDEGRIGRDCVRLLVAGADPLDPLRAAIRFGGERGHRGFGPALAACADLARIVPLYAGHERAVPLTQALVTVARANRGRHQRPIPEQRRNVLVGSADARRRLFLQHVEAGDADAAEAMLSGALWQGLSLSEAQQWLLAAACRRPVDRGVILPWTVKALDLCATLGMREALHVLPPLVPRLVDGLDDGASPGPVRDMLALLERGLDDTLPPDRSGSSAAPMPDERVLRNVVLDGTATEAFEAMHAALRAGMPPVKVGVALALAAAERALRFDERAEWSDAGSQAWADVLDPFAHAVAAMRAVERWPSAATLPALFLAAAFIGAARAAALPEERWSGLHASPVPAALDAALGEVASAIRERRSLEAARRARGFVEAHDGWRLAEAFARLVVEDVLPSQAHLEQGAAVVIGAVDAWQSADGHPDAWLLLALAARVLGAESRQSFVARDVRRAIARLGTVRR